jgi:hypothetical protein
MRLGTRQLLGQFNTNSQSENCDWNHTSNTSCLATPFSYFVFFKRRLVHRTLIETRLPMNNSTFVVSLIFINQGTCTAFVAVSGIIRQLNSTECLTSVIVLLERKSQRVFTVIETTWLMNFSSWLSSVIFSFRRSERNLTLRSKPHDKWLLHSDSFYLFCHFHAKIRSSYCDPSGMTNEYF